MIYKGHEKVKSYSSNINILIETGTYYGVCIDVCKDSFSKIISIEIGKKLYENAKKKYSKNNNIELYNGNSYLELNKILKNINERCVFWLDAHYSEGNTEKGELDCYLIEELKSIEKHHIKNHVIIIDNIECCEKLIKDYPSISELINQINMINLNYNIKIEESSKNNKIMICET